MMNCFKKNNKKIYKERYEEDEPLIEIVNEISEKISLDLKEIIKVRLNKTKNCIINFNVNKFQDIEADDKSNQSIINSIDVLVDNKNSNREYLRNFKTDIDDYSLLHLAAKNLRYRVCKHLVDAINIGIL